MLATLCQIRKRLIDWFAISSYLLYSRLGAGGDRVAGSSVNWSLYMHEEDGVGWAKIREVL